MLPADNPTSFTLALTLKSAFVLSPNIELCDETVEVENGFCTELLLKLAKPDFMLLLDAFDSVEVCAVTVEANNGFCTVFTELLPKLVEPDAKGL